ncbi:UNVERIFIED_CONTAM: hypothetical protein HDU68_009825 [Siphonaria sp. JEL0065]|nr:hypothetical protein HDU68_009825 [Siphonaria sp. JEL0065]
MSGNGILKKRPPPPPLANRSLSAYAGLGLASPPLPGAGSSSNGLVPSLVVTSLVPSSSGLVPHPSQASLSNSVHSLASFSSSTESTKLVKALDADGRKLINQYAVIREIGRGVHGKVKLASDGEDASLWAIKILDKRAKKKFQNRFAFSQSLQIQRLNSVNGGPNSNPNSNSTFDAMNNMQFEKVKREIAILKKISHPNVVGLKEVIDDPEAEKIYLVLEFMGGGEVEWRDVSWDPPRPALTIPEARRIVRDVISGLEYLHHNGIIHRDIKPANLLWTEDRQTVKISDFGVSVFIDLQSTVNLVSTQMELAKTAGSPAFFAPELCAVIDDDSASVSSNSDEKGVMEDVSAIDGNGGTATSVMTGSSSFISNAGASLPHHSIGPSTSRSISSRNGLNGKNSSKFFSSESTINGGSSGSALPNARHSQSSLGDQQQQLTPETLNAFQLVEKLKLAQSNNDLLLPLVTKPSLITTGLSSLETSPMLGPKALPFDKQQQQQQQQQSHIPAFSINDLELDFTNGATQFTNDSSLQIDMTPRPTIRNSFTTPPPLIPQQHQQQEAQPQHARDRASCSDLDEEYGASVDVEAVSTEKLENAVMPKRRFPKGTSSSASSAVSGMDRYRRKYSSASGGAGRNSSSEYGMNIPEATAVVLEIGAAIDVWALGVTLYCLVFGRVPFIAETEFELFHVICKAPLEFPAEPQIDDSLKDVFYRLLDKNPETRITLHDLKTHPWITHDLDIQQGLLWTNQDPVHTFGRPLTVTAEEVSQAVRPAGAFAKIRDGFKKIVTRSVSALGKRSKSLSNMFSPSSVGSGASSSNSGSPNRRGGGHNSGDSFGDSLPGAAPLIAVPAPPSMDQSPSRYQKLKSRFISSSSATPNASATPLASSSSTSSSVSPLKSPARYSSSGSWFASNNNNTGGQLSTSFEYESPARPSTSSVYSIYPRGSISGGAGVAMNGQQHYPMPNAPPQQGSGGIPKRSLSLSAKEVAEVLAMDNVPTHGGVGFRSSSPSHLDDLNSQGDIGGRPSVSSSLRDFLTKKVPTAAAGATTLSSNDMNKGLFDGSSLIGPSDVEERQRRWRERVMKLKKEKGIDFGDLDDGGDGGGDRTVRASFSLSDEVDTSESPEDVDEYVIRERDIMKTWGKEGSDASLVEDR